MKLTGFSIAAILGLLEASRYECQSIQALLRILAQYLRSTRRERSCEWRLIR